MIGGFSRHHIGRSKIVSWVKGNVCLGKKNRHESPYEMWPRKKMFGANHTKVWIEANDIARGTSDSACRPLASRGFMETEISWYLGWVSSSLTALENQRLLDRHNPRFHKQIWTLQELTVMNSLKRTKNMQKPRSSTFSQLDSFKFFPFRPIVKRSKANHCAASNFLDVQKLKRISAPMVKSWLVWGPLLWFWKWRYIISQKAVQ